MRLGKISLYTTRQGPCMEVDISLLSRSEESIKKGYFDGCCVFLRPIVASASVAS